LTSASRFSVVAEIRALAVAASSGDFFRARHNVRIGRATLAITDDLSLLLCDTTTRERAVTDTSQEERQAIRDTFHRLLAEQSGEAQVRHSMASESGYDPVLWKHLSETGLLGVLIPAEYGGIGVGSVELELLMEEAGAALLCAPFLSSAVLASGLLSMCSDAPVKTRLLPQLASGKTIATVAMTGERGLWTPDDVTVTAVDRGDEWELDGVASFVTAGTQANLLLVIGRTPTGLGTFEVHPDCPGVVIQPLESFDRTQRLARISFKAAQGVPIAGADATAIDRMLDLTRVALAGEQAGAARRVLDMTVEYIKTRVQFGRPVGGFQAIKHMAADLLLEVESSISAARHAAQALADGAPDAQALVNLAAFACADAFSAVAAAAIQMHGGIAFTWEHAAHLYLRRARADALLFGSPNFYRERYLSVFEKAI
jgi:alkylation response protein AidB-like acyl-CoA dehydrogenase